MHTFIEVRRAQEGILYDRLVTETALARAPLYMYVVVTDKADVIFEPVGVCSKFSKGVERNSRSEDYSQLDVFHTSTPLCAAVKLR